MKCVGLRLQFVSDVCECNCDVIILKRFSLAEEAPGRKSAILVSEAEAAAAEVA